LIIVAGLGYFNYAQGPHEFYRKGNLPDFVASRVFNLLNHRQDDSLKQIFLKKLSLPFGTECGSFSVPFRAFPKSVNLKPVRGLSQVPKGSRPEQKKKKNWDNFLGANLQVCHPKGSF
jgi:hypothetical protein